MQTTPTNAEACTSYPESEKIVNFCGFESMYDEVLEIEHQWLRPEVQAQVGDEYSELKNSFKQFQEKLREVIVETKRKRGSTMHLLTIHDMFRK